jgi:metal-dependent amidase/aminoacylase/carboxypeptidase family protein
MKVRTLDSKVQEMIHDKVNQIVTNIAESAGATAEISLNKYHITILLTELMLPSPGNKGEANVILAPARTEQRTFLSIKKSS